MRECANCGAAMQDAQDWCMQCGAARPGLLGRRPGWLTAAGVLAVTVLLVVGASVAAYAALSKHTKAHKQLALRPATTVSPSPTPGVPSTTTTTPVVPATPGGTPTTPSGAVPPKIPTQTPTPEGSGGSKEANNLLFPPEEKGVKAANSGKAGKSSKSKGSGGKGSSEGLTGGGVEEGSKGEGSNGSGASSQSGEPEGPEPIVLDPNAASTYNPNAYPSTLFGDPSLTIDGDASTAWATEVQASLAPQVNAGIVLDLRTAQKLGTVTIKTKTPGIAVEVYGANGHNVPALLTDPTWKKLHGARLLKKKKVTIKLKTKGAAYRFVLLWIVKAPASSTPADPGKVAIRELELFPPS